MKPQPSTQNKSTTGRFILPLLERWAPDWLEARALSSFGRPRRPRTPREPSVPGARKFTLEVGGHGLAAWEWGTGPTVLLVHGWSGFSGQMQHFVNPLVAGGFHVVAVDLPAHGQSAGDWLTLPLLAETLSSLMFRLRPRAVIAHSFGASAMALAVKEGGYRPQKLVLIAPPVEVGTFVRRAVAEAGLSQARAEGMIRRIEKIVGRPIAQFDLRYVARSLDVPTALVHDAGDDEVPFGLLEEAVKVWPNCTLSVTQGYGHSGYLRSAEFCEATAAFIAGKVPQLEFPLERHGEWPEPAPRQLREQVKSFAQAVSSASAR